MGSTVYKAIYRSLALSVLAMLLSACASLPENLLQAPDVQLRDIKATKLGFGAQTFVLTFDAANTNGIAIPVRNVGYTLKLDGRHFASGETATEFSIPARGSSQFEISVDLDLLSSAPQLMSLIRDRSRDDIPYRLEGRFGVDLPLVPELRYSNDGAIRISADTTTPVPR